MRFEGADCTFSGIASVDVGPDELVLGSPVRRNGGFEVLASLVVKDLQIDVHVGVFEALHYEIVGLKTMLV